MCKNWGISSMDQGPNLSTCDNLFANFPLPKKNFRMHISKLLGEKVGYFFIKTFSMQDSKICILGKQLFSNPQFFKYCFSCFFKNSNCSRNYNIYLTLKKLKFKTITLWHFITPM